jgi:phosphate transport system substrate-binding protein
MGGVVPVYNLKGIGASEIRFTGELLASIYLGKVKKWNDPAIASLNPGVKLPGDTITVVHRSDGSGTTFLWTNYLSKVSADWKSAVGEGTSVKWPAGVGGKGNEGVASYVQKINGSLGYVEYAYAKQNKLTAGQMQNKAGKFVAPTDTSFKAAAAGAEWTKTPGMGVVLTDQPGEGSWPVTGASFILIHKAQDKPDAGREVLKFFEWAFANGEKMADELDYVPMPAAVVKVIQAEWKGIKDASGKPVY